MGCGQEWAYDSRSSWSERTFLSCTAPSVAANRPYLQRLQSQKPISKIKVPKSRGRGRFQEQLQCFSDPHKVALRISRCKTSLSRKEHFLGGSSIPLIETHRGLPRRQA